MTDRDFFPDVSMATTNQQLPQGLNQANKTGPTGQIRIVTGSSESKFESITDRVESAVVASMSSTNSSDVSLYAQIVRLTDPSKSLDIVLPVSGSACLLGREGRAFVSISELDSGDFETFSRVLTESMRAADRYKVTREPTEKMENSHLGMRGPDAIIFQPGGRYHVRIHVDRISKCIPGDATRYGYMKDGVSLWSIFLGNQTSPSVAVSLDAATLHSQFTRMNAGQTNGFSLLVRDFIGNALEVARAVDRASPRLSRTLFFPGVFDMAAEVRQHYDAKMARFTRQEESKSGMIRKYNNQVKSAILNHFVPQRAVVLDLACGHGQDLLKFRNKAPKLYVGTDIAQAALNEAQRRYRENRLSYPAQFIPGNLRLADVYQSIMEVASAQGYADTAVFDTVSMQLAIHYLIGSREDAHEFLSRVAGMMRSGAQFIVTLPCCDRIANRLRSIKPVESFNSFEFGNDLYNVTFTAEELLKLVPNLTQAISEGNMDAFDSVLADTDFDEVVLKASTTWGVKYMFWLVDTIERQEEYLVPMESLSQVASGCGLSVEVSCNFAEVPNLFPDSVTQTGPGGRRQAQPVVLSDIEEEVSNIYRAVVFKKL